MMNWNHDYLEDMTRFEQEAIKRIEWNCQLLIRRHMSGGDRPLAVLFGDHAYIALDINLTDETVILSGIKTPTDLPLNPDEVRLALPAAMTFSDLASVIKSPEFGNLVYVAVGEMGSIIEFQLSDDFIGALSSVKDIIYADKIA